VAFGFGACSLTRFWISVSCSLVVVAAFSYPAPDTLAHAIIPTHPTLKPHTRMLHQFRFILPLLPVDEDGLTPLHYYDSAIQLARHSNVELSEQEFEMGMTPASEILKWYVDLVGLFRKMLKLCSLTDCHLEMLEGSSTQLDVLSFQES
jgi:hypothetical protein